MAGRRLLGPGLITLAAVHRAGDLIDGRCVTGWSYPLRQTLLLCGTP